MTEPPQNTEPIRQDPDGTPPPAQPEAQAGPQQAGPQQAGPGPGWESTAASFFGTATGMPGTGEPPFAARYGLIRPLAGRQFAGVCAGIGRATTTDPVLWRILLAVLALFGGVGLVAYLIAWMLMPAEGDTASPLEAMLGRGSSRTSPGLVLGLGAVTLLTLMFSFSDGFRSAILGSAVIVGAALLLSRRGQPNQPGTLSADGFVAAAPVPPASAPAPPGTVPPGTGEDLPEPGGTDSGTVFLGKTPPAEETGVSLTKPTHGTPVTPPPWPEAATPWPEAATPLVPHGPFVGTSSYAASLGYTYPPAASSPTGYPGLDPVTAPSPPYQRKPRTRSVLRRITLSMVCLAMGALALIHVALVPVAAPVYLATALVIIGLGLLVGAWFGRARTLIPLGIILSLALFAVANGKPMASQHREQTTWVPASVELIQPTYQLDYGDARLDLSGVDFTDKNVDVTVVTNVGSLRVILPPHVDVDVTATINVGSAHVFDEHWSGLNSEQHTVRDLGNDGAGGGHIQITAKVDLGNLEVSR